MLVKWFLSYLSYYMHPFLTASVWMEWGIILWINTVEGGWGSKPIKSEGLYDGFDHAPTVNIQRTILYYLYSYYFQLLYDWISKNTSICSVIIDKDARKCQYMKFRTLIDELPTLIYIKHIPCLVDVRIV